MKIAVVAPTEIPALQANTIQVMKMTQAFAELGTGDLPEFFTFADALNAISTIEYQCTRSGIRSLLTRAVNNTPTNLDVDRNTGTVMFKSDQQTVGTTQSVKPGTASPEKPKVTGKVNSPEQPTSSGAHQPAAAAVAPPVVSPTPQ